MDATMPKGPLSEFEGPLSFEAIRQRFKQETDLVLDRDDPLLGVLIMLQAGVEVHETLIGCHSDTLSQTMKANVDALVGRIAEKTEKFADQALNESIQEKLGQLAEHQRYTDEIRVEARSLLRSIKILTSINLVAVTVISGLVVAVFM